MSKLQVYNGKRWVEIGKDGRDADETLVVEEVKKLIPKIEDLEKDIPKLGEKIRDSLELLQGEDRLDKSAIKGLDELESKIKESGGQIKGNKATFLYVDGVKKGLINTLDISAGDNTTVEHSKVNGLDTITISSTASNPTWVVEQPSGLVNGSNLDYVLTYTPVSNSPVLYATNNSNGVPLILGVHFTLAGKTATLGTARVTGEIWAHYQTLDTVV